MNAFQRMILYFKQRYMPLLIFRVRPLTYYALQKQAYTERREIYELAESILEDGLQRRRQQEAALAAWEKLTPRQQQVIALYYQGYGSEEISRVLSIANGTVKTHFYRALGTLGLTRRYQLFQYLSGWDFEDWLEEAAATNALNYTNLVASAGANEFWDGEEDETEEF